MASESMSARITTTVTSSVEKAKKQQQELVVAVKKQYNTIVQNPEFKTITICTAGGAITFGTAGGAFGTAAGVVVGSAAGLIPALFTFGLSIPAGAAVGGAGGLTVGSTSGALVGGAAGFGGYKYRVQIKDGVIYVKKRALTTVDTAKSKTKAVLDATYAKLLEYEAMGEAQFTLFVDKTKALAVSKTKTARAFSTQKYKSVKAFSAKKYEQAVAVAKDPKVQVTTASAAGGGVAGGVTGGGVGLVAGAALGVVPALFTFGLSIPIGATIGLATGAVGGSAVGAVSCGTAGYVGYAKRKQIGEGVQSAVTKTSESVDFVKVKAQAKAGQFKQSVKALVSPAGTGSTACFEQLCCASSN